MKIVLSLAVAALVGFAAQDSFAAKPVWVGGAVDTSETKEDGSCALNSDNASIVYFPEGGAQGDWFIAFIRGTKELGKPKDLIWKFKGQEIRTKLDDEFFEDAYAFPDATFIKELDRGSRLAKGGAIRRGTCRAQASAEL